MGKKNENNELATVSANNDLALPALPSHVENKRAGFENVVDMTFERLSLLQAMSPEVQKAGSELRAGMLYRRSTNEVCFMPGSAPMPIIIAYYFKEWVEFGDRDDPSSSMVVARTTDPSSKLAEESRQWVKKRVSKGEVRKVQDVHNFVVLRDGFPNDPLLLGLMRSNARYGSGLLNLANGRGNVPIYAGRFFIYTEQDTNKRNQTYWTTKFKNPEKTAEAYWANETMYNAAKTLNEMLSEAHKTGKLGGNYQSEDTSEAESEVGKDL
jgi:hypothetical protein